MNVKAVTTEKGRAILVAISLGVLLVAAMPAFGQVLDLTVTKNLTGEASQGQVITNTIGVSVNDSITSTFTEVVTLTDVLPGGLTYVIQSMVWGCGFGAPGQPGNIITATVPIGQTQDLICQGIITDGASLPLVYTATVDTSNMGPVTNTVQVRGSGTDLNPGDNVAAASIFLNPEPPIPSLNEWGLLILSLLLAATAVVYFRKQRTA